MSTIKISDLNPVTSLIDSEMSNIRGGYWGDGVVNKIAGGFKRAGQGSRDHSAKSSPRYDDLWYNIGYSLSDYI